MSCHVLFCSVRLRFMGCYSTCVRATVRLSLRVHLCMLRATVGVCISVCALVTVVAFVCLHPHPSIRLYLTIHDTLYLTLHYHTCMHLLSGKRNVQSSRASAFDSVQASIHVGDTVNVVTGAHIKKCGTIKHIMKGLWVCVCMSVFVCVCMCVSEGMWISHAISHFSPAPFHLFLLSYFIPPPIWPPPPSLLPSLPTRSSYPLPPLIPSSSLLPSHSLSSLLPLTLSSLLPCPSLLPSLRNTVAAQQHLLKELRHLRCEGSVLLSRWRQGTYCMHYTLYCHTFIFFIASLLLL